MVRRDDGAVVGEIGWHFVAEEPGTARIGYSIVVMEKAGMREVGIRLGVEDGETVELVRYEARRAK